MDEGQQHQYEERLKEVFHSFDSSGAGSLCPGELAELCQALRLEDAAPVLLHALLENQDRLSGRVDFDQFKNALILVLSTSVEEPPTSQESSAPPDSPEVLPKFVKGSKRYGRRSAPEFIESKPDADAEPERGEEEDPQGSDDSTVPRKRERWNVHDSSAEEYEAEGQLHLWNPDEPGTLRGPALPLSARQERLRVACEELALPWNGRATHHQLLALCEHLGMEVTEKVFLALEGDDEMSVQEFVSFILNQSQPPTPSSSTPYRQLKRHHSTQTFDEMGRRIATPSAMSGTIGLRLFSSLDDGTGYAPVEYLLDAWLEEGIENSPEILQALDFSLDDKVNLSELTVALENELLITKNGIHQAALASFKSEIRHLLERVDQELREKEKVRADLEKAEKLKSQLASEVDEHHSAIERMNDLNLRKLEQEHRERLSVVSSELTREMDLVQQQANQQRDELEQEIVKIREDDTFLRDHLTLTVKENGRLELELLDRTERLVEAENQASKLQTNLDNILRERFGGLDPSSAELFLQEDRLRQLHSSYKQQCRELQDRIDELQAQLEEYHVLGRAPQTSLMPSLSDELENRSSCMESDQGLGSEEGQIFNMSLEAEMMLEQLKEQHAREVENVQAQLETQVNEYHQRVEEQRAAHEEEGSALSLRHQEELRAMWEEVQKALVRSGRLQKQLEEAEEEQRGLEQSQAKEREEKEKRHEEEVLSLRQEVEKAQSRARELEEQLRALEEQHAAVEQRSGEEREELDRLHTETLGQLELQHAEALQARLEVERERLQGEREEVERSLREDWKREREQLQLSHEEVLEVRIEVERQRFQEECSELEARLTEEWQRERAQLEEQNKQALQVVLEEQLLRMLKEQEEREKKLVEQWIEKRMQIKESHEAALQNRLAEQEERLKAQEEETERRLVEEFERERTQLKEYHEGVLLARLGEEREWLQAESEEVERRLQEELEEEKARLEESHREAMQELSTKHSEERERLSSLLDKLRGDITDERRELESHFSQRIREVESRFSGNQATVSERFQTDMANLEQHYQSKLCMLAEQHANDRARWEAETEAFVQEAEEQQRMLREALELERESVMQDLTRERDQLELSHSEEMEALRAQNQVLRNELESFVSAAQTKETELSRQLNELHNWLQENLEAKDKLLAQSDKKAMEIELLLRQAMENLAQERAELQSNLADLEARHTETLELEEMKELLSEREELKAKIQEIEQLLRQAVDDFENERLELQANLTDLEDKLKKKRISSALKEGERTELLADRNRLAVRIQELEAELGQPSGDHDQDPNTEAEMVTKSVEPCPENITINVEACEQDCDNTDEEASHLEDEMQCDAHITEWTIPEEDEEDVENAEVDFAEMNDDIEVVDAEVDDSAEVHDDAEVDDSAVIDNAEEDNNVEVTDAEVAEDMDAEDQAVIDNAEVVDAEVGHYSTIQNKTELDHSKEVDKAEEAEIRLDDTHASCLQERIQELEKEAKLMPKQEEHREEVVRERDDCTCDILELQERLGQFQDEAYLLTELQDQYSTATESNLFLLQQVSQLQQRTDKLEGLLEANGEKGVTSQESCDLKAEISAMAEQAKELETKTLELTELQIRYEESICENVQLGEQNSKLEKRVLSLESKMHIIQNFHDQHSALLDEIAHMREENLKLSAVVLEKQDEILALQREAEFSESESFLDLNSQLEAKIQAMSDLEDCCMEFERQNRKLRRALIDLQEKSLRIHGRMQAHRSKAGRLAEENITLRQKISAIKEEDLRETQEEMLLKLEHFKKEMIAEQRMSESFRRPISELRRRGQALEDENGLLSQRNAKNTASVEELSVQLGEVLRRETHTYRSSNASAEERAEMVACVSALEAELKKAQEGTVLLEQEKSQLIHQVSFLREQLCGVEDCASAVTRAERLQEEKELLREELNHCVEKMAKLGAVECQLSHLLQERQVAEKQNQVLRTQLSKTQEKLQTLDDALQAINLQSSRLKSDLRVTQQESNALKQEVISQHKQLQNSNDKCQKLEMALHSSGYQNQHKKLYWDELARIVEQEQQLLRQENERLQREYHSTNAELHHTREKTRQLEASVLSLKQRDRASLAKAVEQEKHSLRRELDTLRKELLSKSKVCETGELERLRQENEVLKTRQARLEAQLREALQLGGMLPQSPVRLPGERRGPHHGDEHGPEFNLQEERELKMLKMEERMREVELTLRNVKMLLQEKVSQLKEQLHKNGKADVVIKDLYVENTQLLKALELTEQRQKVAEKKNYLLEEKISSLNKIVRDLKPSSPMTSMPFHFTRS